MYVVLTTVSQRLSRALTCYITISVDTTLVDYQSPSVVYYALLGTFMLEIFLNKI